MAHRKSSAFSAFLLALLVGAACRSEKAAPTDWYVVAVEGLALREHPRASARTIAQLPYGTRVKFLDQAPQRDEDGVLWLEVERKSERGWASGDLLNTTPVDLARIDRRDLKGLVLFSAPSNLKLQGGQLLGTANGKEYGLSHYRHKGADLFLLERKLRYVGDRVEWMVVDALVLDPAPRYLVPYGSPDGCRDNQGKPLQIVGNSASAGVTRGDQVEQRLVRAWRVEEGSERFVPISPEGLVCRVPASP